MDYQLLVIGAGPGGYVAAIKAAQRGLTVALVERGAVGGTCLNRGCVPTKALLHAADLLRGMRECDRFGLTCGPVGFDFARVQAYRDETVSKLRGGVEQLILANRIALIRGEAQIAAPGRVTVTSDGEIRTLTADHILIATGAKPVCPPIAGRELPGVVTSDGLLTGSPRFPEKLVIVGGGVIGVEFASAFSAFGSHVTLIEALPRLLANMDRELSQNLSMILKKRGVELVTDAAVERIEQIPDGLLCRFSHRGESASVQADQLLIATGRRADTEGLFADGLLIERDRGALRVNERFETSVPGIYAIGDAMAGGIQLAHAASAQGENAVAAICGEPMPVNLAAVPSCVYTDPEIASVGLTADQAKERGMAVRVGKFLMSANAKSLLTAQERGFVKLVFDAQSEVLLGAQLMCARATDLIGELSCAVANGLTEAQLTHALRPHPTFCEAVTEAAEDAFGRAVHILPKKRL